jgi:dUTP pyrophosphatase
MKIRLKRLHPNAVIPRYAYPNDACVDLTATTKLETDDYIEYGFGWAIEVPIGWVGVMRPNSRHSKRDLVFASSGEVDSGFRGELTLRYKKVKNNSRIPRSDMDWNIYEVGDVVAQLRLTQRPDLEFEEDEELSKSERGTGGYGSSEGKKPTGS